MHQSLANTAQLVPGTNLIRILKYFKKCCFFSIFFLKMKIMPQIFCGACQFPLKQSFDYRAPQLARIGM